LEDALVNDQRLGVMRGGRLKGSRTGLKRLADICKNTKKENGQVSLETKATLREGEEL